MIRWPSSSPAARPVSPRARGTRTATCWRWPRSTRAATPARSRRCRSISPPACRSRTSARWRASGCRSRFLGTTIIHDAFDPAAVLAVIERERLEHLGGFPTQIIMLLDHPDRPRRDLTSLKSIVLGGAPSSPELIRRIQRELGVDRQHALLVDRGRHRHRVAARRSAGDPHDDGRQADGRASSCASSMRTTSPLPTDEVGEVVVRSPATMRGYWRDPEATAKTIDADGWVHTGDLGYLDAAGYLHLRGRQSEMFIRGGYNVYPAEIEDLLAKHPKVARAAVHRRAGSGLRRNRLGVRRPARPTDAADAGRAARLRRRRAGELQAPRRPERPRGAAADADVQGRQARAARAAKGSAPNRALNHEHRWRRTENYRESNAE